MRRLEQRPQSGRLLDAPGGLRRRSSRPSRRPTAGKDVSFKQSYGASGDQARAVEAGLDADVVALSLAPDVDKLVEAGKVADELGKDKYDGFVTNSVVVLTVRKGNPKNIQDLGRPAARTASR